MSEIPRPKVDPIVVEDRRSVAQDDVVGLERLNDIPERFRVDGRVLPLYLHPDVKCESQEMLSLARMVQSLGSTTLFRWFWKSEDGNLLPDQFGNSGCWVLCRSGKIAWKKVKKFDGEQGVGDTIEHIPAWLPYFWCIHPVFQEYPLTDTDEIDVWMRVLLPCFYEGTPEQRKEAARKKLTEMARDFAEALTAEQENDTRYRLMNSRRLWDAQSYFSVCDPQKRREVSVKMARNAEKRWVERQRKFDAGFQHTTTQHPDVVVAVPR